MKICPRCKSTNITFLGGHSWQQAQGIFTAKCRECGYEGPMAEIDESKLKKNK